MPERFQYAILRVVPDIERGEQINVGVVLHCRRLGLLAARVELDRGVLAAVAPSADAEAIERHPVNISAEQLKFIEDHGSSLLSESFYDYLVGRCAAVLLPLI